jgi:hypothetical protein
MRLKNFLRLLLPRERLGSERLLYNFGGLSLLPSLNSSYRDSPMEVLGRG